MTIGKNKFPRMAGLKKALKARLRMSGPVFRCITRCRKKKFAISSGVDLIESMMAIFEEVTPAMNLCMQIQLK